MADASRRRTGAELAYVPIDDEGVLDLDALDALLARGPKVVAVAHVSNVLGTVNPIAEIARRAHAAGAIVVVDGAQAVPHMPVDVARARRRLLRLDRAQGLRPDGHRRPARPPRAARGDAAVARRRAHDHQGRPVESTWAEPPAQVRGGDDAGRRGDRARRRRRLARANRDGRGPGARRATSSATRSSASPRCRGSRSTGRATSSIRGGAVSFALDGMHPHDVAEILGREGVCVRAGHHCAQPLMRRLGVAATSRASFAVHSTREDVDRLVDGARLGAEVFA